MERRLESYFFARVSRGASSPGIEVDGEISELSPVLFSVIQNILVLASNGILCLSSHLLHKFILNLLLIFLVLIHFCEVLLFLLSGRPHWQDQLSVLMLKLFWVPVDIFFVVLNHQQ